VRLDGHLSDFTDRKRAQFLEEFASELVNQLRNFSLFNRILNF
jgi:hypothetical protein